MFVGLEPDMSPLNALIVAEKLVDNLGDPNWFREHYTLAREYHGVLDSVEMALERQGLLEAFREVMQNA
jgi:hypothetical protein